MFNSVRVMGVGIVGKMPLLIGVLQKWQVVSCFLLLKKYNLTKTVKIVS